MRPKLLCELMVPNVELFDRAHSPKSLAKQTQERRPTLE